MERVVFKLSDGSDNLRRVAFSPSDVSFNKLVQVSATLFEGWNHSSVITVRNRASSVSILFFCSHHRTLCFPS
jgi:hypothetical protein